MAGAVSPAKGQRDHLTFSPTQCLSAGRVTPRPRPGQGAGNEALDGIEDLISVAQPGPVVDSGHLDKLGTSDMRCEVAAIAHVHTLLAGAMDDQRRDIYL